jgi:serine/threonine protein kinase
VLITIDKGNIMQLWRYGHTIDRLGQRYRLRGLLGSGAMADVCLAWDERERREVAVKVIKSDVLDQKTLNSFLKEASQVVGWKHPNILPVYEDMKLQLLDAKLGSIVPYIVMEYARGGDLQRRLTLARPYPLGETLRIFGQLCSAVHYAHEHGVIHRDLKPLNILFRLQPNGTEQVVLSDFGLSVHVDATHHTFSLAGTLEYMAPEQFRGHVEPASDIFALGVILYQLCTGKVPFHRSLADLKHISGQGLPPRPSSISPALPSALDDVMMKAFAEDPLERYQSAADFWQSVRKAVLNQPQQAAFGLGIDTGRTVGSSLKVAALPGQELGDQRGFAVERRHAGESTFDYPDHLEKVTRKIPVLDSGDRTTRKIPIPELRDKTTGRIPVPAMEAKAIPTDSMDARSQSAQAEAAGAPAAIADPEIGRNSDVALDVHDGASKRKRYLPRRQPFLVVIGTLVMLLLLVLAGIVVDVQGKSGFLARLLAGTPSSSIVTITPASKDLENVYVIDAVTGIPDASQQQVAARQITASFPLRSTTVKTTGDGHPGVRATGILAFSNATNAAVTIPAGEVFTDAHGVQVTYDAAVTIPAANGTTPGHVDVPAHAVNVGISGDIAANDIAQSCCAMGISVKNIDKFSGGQNSHYIPIVQQSDIDGAAKSLESSLSQSAQTALQGQLALNERFISPAQCLSNVKSDVPVGSKATEVTVTVTVDCKGEVYDQHAMQSIVAGLLRHEAEANLGTHYALVGNVVAVVTQAAVIDANQGATALLVKAEGVWVYYFSSAEQRGLIRLILGKSTRAAENILLKQVGVAQLKFQIPGNNETALPSDAGQVKIVVQSVAGLHESLSPITVPGSHI